MLRLQYVVFYSDFGEGGDLGGALRSLRLFLRGFGRVEDVELTAKVASMVADL